MMLDLAIFRVSLSHIVSEKAFSEKGGYGNIPFKYRVVVALSALGPH